MAYLQFSNILISIGKKLICPLLDSISVLLCLVLGLLLLLVFLELTNGYRVLFDVEIQCL